MHSSMPGCYSDLISRDPRRSTTGNFCHCLSSGNIPGVFCATGAKGELSASAIERFAGNSDALRLGRWLQNLLIRGLKAASTLAPALA